ncbi:MAG: DUF2971 domain-containing protein [Flavobacteriales bacterium]|jgi:hypothetical protein|nr:DUF2971 domain-containing protein [Flavobacteriales bacterium]
MWANYADKHKGVCLVFNKDELEFQPLNTVVDGIAVNKPTGPHEVKYTKKYLDSNPLSNELNQVNFLTTKFDVWKNEKEYRYISSRSGSYKFEINSLQEIIFGLRISPSAIKTIRNIYKDNETISYRQIELNDSEFGFRLKEL